MVLPTGIITSILSIDTFDGPVAKAFPPMSVTLRLKDDIDISRGDLITGVASLPETGSEIELMICWMNPMPLRLNGKYVVRHNTREVKCVVDRIEFVLNISTLEQIIGRETLKMNDIGKIHLLDRTFRYFLHS